MLLLMYPSAVVLSSCTGVGGCGWPISHSVTRIGTASLALMKAADTSASTAEVTTDEMIFAMLRTAPLLGGTGMSLESTKWPPALLRAFDSVRYDASLF